MRARQRLESDSRSPRFSVGARGDRSAWLRRARRRSSPAAACATLFWASCPRFGFGDLGLARRRRGELRAHIDVGKDFGTIVVVADGRQLEITTFRREGDYRDGRRPSTVEFTDAREDAARRDFYRQLDLLRSARETILDFENGRGRSGRAAVAHGGRARAPVRRRLFVACCARFASSRKLGFSLDADTAHAIRAGADNHARGSRASARSPK